MLPQAKGGSECAQCANLRAKVAVAERMAQALRVADRAIPHGLPGSIYGFAHETVRAALAKWEALK